MKRISNTEWSGRSGLTFTELMVALAIFGAKFVDRDFFPDTARNEMIVNLNFAEGTHISTTSAAAVEMADALLRLPEVEDVYTWTGFSGPVFFYNLRENPRSPHIGRLGVMARSAADITAISDWVREYARVHLPDVGVVPHRLGQGPPVALRNRLVFVDDPFPVCRPEGHPLARFGKSLRCLRPVSPCVVTLLPVSVGLRDVQQIIMMAWSCRH